MFDQISKADATSTNVVVEVPMTWPKGYPRLVLDVDMLQADVDDLSVGVSVEAYGLVDDKWQLLTSGGLNSDRVKGDFLGSPHVNCVAPPAGTPVLVKVIPLGKRSVTVGVTIRGTDSPSGKDVGKPL